MKIVIVGFGKVGFALAEQLSKEGHDIVIVDNDSAALEKADNLLEVMCVEGNGAIYNVQIEAGVPNSDLLIAVTSTDEMNILCCLVAKKLGIKHTIARVRNPEYADQLVIMREELGLSMSVNPEQAAAVEISRLLRFPSALKIDTFAKGRVELVEFKIGPGCPLDGMPLYELTKKYAVKVLICAVERNDQVFIPGGGFVLQEGDRISITASPAEIQLFFKSIGESIQKVRNVMIVGGSRIALYLARLLEEMGMSVKIIEHKEKRCHDLSSNLSRAMVICGDGMDQELLSEEDISGMDAFVALTGIDEENIIVSMYAATKGVGKIITKINKAGFSEILQNTGIDSIISPKTITAHQILRYVRAMQNSFGSNVETLHKIVDDRVEALEFNVREDIRFLGVPLKDLVLRPNLLIACLTRHGRVIIPGGNDAIEAGDSVVVVTTNRGLRDLSDILA